jgi:hypothetical protein
VCKWGSKEHSSQAPPLFGKFFSHYSFWFFSSYFNIFYFIFGLCGLFCGEKKIWFFFKILLNFVVFYAFIGTLNNVQHCIIHEKKFNLYHNQRFENFMNDVMEGRFEKNPTKQLNKENSKR